MSIVHFFALDDASFAATISKRRSRKKFNQYDAIRMNETSVRKPIFFDGPAMLEFNDHLPKTVHNLVISISEVFAVFANHICQFTNFKNVREELSEKKTLLF